MRTFRLIFFLCFCLLSSPVHAQDYSSYLQADPERTAGYFHHYEIGEGPETATCPEGYTPFYISHFGRHGCRWHTSERLYEQTLERFEEAHRKNSLTEEGEKFRQQLEILAADADGRLGDLSPRGVQEHRGIAERMFRRYPEVFRPGARIDSRSTRVIRCILSMAAFDERLKELEPSLQITRESSQIGCAFFSGNEPDRYAELKRPLIDSLKTVYLHADRFMTLLFKEGAASLEDQSITPEEFMHDCFELASIAQCNDYLGLDFYPFFTEEELISLWKCINADAYVNMGPAYRYGDARIENTKPLLRDIITEAERAISGKSGLSASLRFGHDSNIIPLLALIGVKSTDDRVPVEQAHECWNVSEISPMATNLQLIFFRNGNEDVKVRVLFRERDAQLPLAGGPFYDWEILRTYLEARLQHCYRYSCVNTEEFRQVLEEAGTVVLDVRTAAEHREGCIPGTDLNIDVKGQDFIEKVREKIPAGAKVAVYCRSGKRSKLASKLLCANGFEVIELASGYNGWVADEK